MKKQNGVWLSILTAVVLSLLLMAGCKKNSVGPTLDSTLRSNQDAAQSISNAVGEDNGGVADQMGDIADATGSTGITANVGSFWTGSELMKSTVVSGDTVVKTFSSSDTSWTVFVSRNRTGLFGRQAGFTRTYYVKFIDASGVGMPRYVTTSPADTASTIIFKVLNGTGYTKTRFASTHLLSLSSDFIVTGANTPTITVNGTLTRTGTDTIQTLMGERVLNYTLTATLQNVTGPRAPRYTLTTRVPRATGGTITGTYAATVTVMRGDSYSDRSFTKTFTITFGSSGGSINMNGSRFMCDVMYGEWAGN